MSKLAKRREAKHEEGALAPRGRPGLYPPSLFEGIEHLFAERWPRWWPAVLRLPETPEVPAVDVFEDGDAVVVKAELPGLKKEELDVQVAAEAVTISGKKEREEKVERKDYYRHERSVGAFTRSVPLPVEVEPEKATAKLEGGVLELRAPKKSGARPKGKKIEVV